MDRQLDAETEAKILKFIEGLGLEARYVLSFLRHQVERTIKLRAEAQAELAKIQQCQALKRKPTEEGKSNKAKEKDYDWMIPLLIKATGC